VFLAPRRVFDAARVCLACGQRVSCAAEAVAAMFTHEDGRPEAWIVRGGLTPREQEDLWARSGGVVDMALIAEAVQ
ncbi:MAG: hypothetical protein OXH11_19370, partial [Candidatus Aminicenantes bacterium]|nr:hypothetical protein [Candidatus Aminicenantes bacterium]